MFTFKHLIPYLSLPLNNPRAGLRVGGLYAELQRTQWLDLADLTQIQCHKLFRLLEHARKKVPFYRDYPSWSQQGDFDIRNRLVDYPVLTKDMIRKSPIAMRQGGDIHRYYSKATTGGTTGSPVEVWRDRHHQAFGTAAHWRGMVWAGVNPLSRGVIAHGIGKGSWYGRIRLWLVNKMLVDGFGKGMPEMKMMAERILRFSPKYISGYVTDVLALGQACNDAGVNIGIILTTGEMLYEHQRLELERLYFGKVSNYYGCNEVGSMAYECEMGQKHVTDEHVIMEVVDKNDNPVWDQPGRILLTDLDNYLTPFIRYEVGDIGVLTREPCRCGRKLTVLKSLEGRTQDALVNQSGGRLSTLFFAGKFRSLKVIHRIQLLQRTATEIDLLYECMLSPADEEIQAICKEIRERLGADMVVTPKHVAQLSHSGRGKCPLIVPLSPGISSYKYNITGSANGI